jgi:hypothetical protein
VTVEDFLDGRGEEARKIRRVKFKLHDKRAALVDLGRHLRLFVEKHKHDIHVDEVDISSVRDTVLSALDRLAAARSAADGDPGAEPRSTILKLRHEWTWWARDEQKPPPGGLAGSTSPDEVLERPAAGPNGFGRRLTQGPTVVITRRTTYQNRANLAGA